MGASRLAELRSAAEKNPDDLDKWLELGEYAADRFIVGISEEALTKVIVGRPNDAKALGLLAKALNRRRKLEDAENVYLRAIEIEPDNPEFLTGLAVVYGNMGENEKSIAWHKKVLEIDKGYPWAILAYCHTLESIGKSEEVMPILDSALKANPKSALINVLMGLEHQKGGKQDLADSHIERGLSLLDSVHCEEQSRTLRMVMDKSPELVEEYSEKLLKKDPDNLELNLYLHIAQSKADPKQASIKLKELLKKDPNNPRIIGILIGILFQLGDIPSVMELKEHLEKEAPDEQLLSAVNMVMANKQAESLVDDKEAREEVLKSAQTILKMRPLDTYANMVYLQALVADGQIDAAREQALKIADIIKPDDVKRVLAFSGVLRALGLNEETSALYQKVLDCADSPYEKVLTQLIMYNHDLNYSQIVKVCSEYIEHNQAEPELYSILGRAQHYTGHADAIKNLQVAAEQGNSDAILLTSSILQKEGSMQRAEKLLRDLISTEGIDSITQARCLIGLKEFDEATNVLNHFLKTHKGEKLGWYLLTLIKRREGRDAVKSVVKAMIDAGAQDTDLTDFDKLDQQMETNKVIDGVTNEVMVGQMGPLVKRILLNNQIMALTDSGLMEEE